MLFVFSHGVFRKATMTPPNPCVLLKAWVCPLIKRDRFSMEFVDALDKNRNLAGHVLKPR